MNSRSKRAIRALAAPLKKAFRAWLVDSGASEHICSPDRIEGSIESTSAVVETANGRINPGGKGTVHVDLLRDKVVAIMLKGSPDLLSLGKLVEAGFKFRWTELDECILTTPEGSELRLEIVNRVPTIP